MRRLFLFFVSLFLFAFGGLLALRTLDTRNEQVLWAQIETRAPHGPEQFHPSMVANQPEIAQRYFNRSLAVGTPLTTVAVWEHGGVYFLNGRERPFSGAQVIDAPAGGFVRRRDIGAGFFAHSWSEALYRAAGPMAREGPLTSWARSWQFGFLPQTRNEGSGDQTRAAVTSWILGGLFVPAALLPQSGAVWRQIGPDRAEIRYPGLPGTAPLRLTLDRTGRVQQFVTLAWSDANAENQYRMQPVGGQVLAYGGSDGVSIPTEVEFGQDWGTAQYRPRYRVLITSYRTLWRD